MEESKDKEKEFEKWLKLISRPLKPVEETEKPKQYIDKRDEYRVGGESGQEEYYQDKEKSIHKKIEFERREYKQTGRLTERLKERLNSIEKELGELGSEGIKLEKIERELYRFKDEIK